MIGIGRYFLIIFILYIEEIYYLIYNILYLGHTLSWGLGGIPGLLTQCLESLPDYFGPIDPTIENNYNFIGTLLNEVNEIFQDHYLHLGGDEIKTFCW